MVHELIEPVRDNLRHGHPYVRRHAVLTVHSIVRNFGAAAFPDAAEDIAKFIREEKDPAARRNAFIMLFDCDQAKALEFYVEHASEVEAYGEGFQLALLELARRTCRKDPAMKARFIGPIFQLLESESAAVAFEAAKWGYIWYVNAVPVYSAVYGPIGAIMALVQPAPAQMARAS